MHNINISIGVYSDQKLNIDSVYEHLDTFRSFFCSVWIGFEFCRGINADFVEPIS